ncbi:Gfo/Idh/MocA family oxidoreductase [Algibacter amylolyticus]|uniref:Gfo/Idh/MocA family oxidoreductase n=1 Tax=Algibacter amylolyticus TaxID=1608400 RepID=A0A5M7B2D8_9FLAO|nr:Gfo/Idh/MocA family oxidoreductase [Algibacter amylolyticus]KAA5821465.1 Gfo/Idh/MocA family oxidoreductase [Algibacter amylolyticus]MBB5268342.1 putative dehydrogenase [Algibacter amylolyticus]TSJ72977.1 Gfo/Idh/MocA family oxidoreductase [Algibacter amylolyticus]
MNWGFIGCGSVTEVKSGPAYQQTKDFNVVAVMRRNEEKLLDYAKRHNIPTTYTDADALINDPNVDAVYIATPPDTHKFYALKIAAAGKPCCIEKPLAPSYIDSLEIQKAFQEKNIPLFVAYYRRSLPRFLKVKEWLDNQLIGDVRHINSHLSKPASELDTSKNYNWRTDNNIAPAGYFDDLASHGLDLFAFFLGDISNAKGISLNQQDLYSAKDAVTASWLHDNGITGSGTWNFGCHQHIDLVTIYGSKGTIKFSVFHENPIYLETDTLKEELFIDNPKHIQKYHVQNMQNYFKDHDKTHPSTGQTALHTSWVMDKILGAI